MRARSRTRRMLAPVLFAGLGLALGAGASPASVDAQMTRVDSAAVLLETADRFEREGRWEIAEALYVHLTERYAGTPAAVEAAARLRAPVTARPARMSRVEMQVFGATYGAWLGIAVPLALGSESSEAYGVGFLVGAPLGLLGARAYQRANPVSEGQARAISWGGVWGTWQGLGWAKVFDIGVDEFCDSFGCYGTEDDTEEVVASMVAGGLMGIVGGALLAREPIPSGVSSGAQGGSTWGSIYGAMVAAMVDDSENAVLTTSLLAGNLGLIAGAALASKHQVSRSRIRMINLGALVGGLGGVGLDLLIQPDDEDIAIAIPLATSLLGMGIAIARTSDGPRGLGGADGPAGAGAFLDYRDGRLSVGAPLPRPDLLRVDAPGEPTRWRPALTFDLFRARF